MKEFTSVLDRRELPEAVGFIVELIGDIVWLLSEGASACDNDTHAADIGPNANPARQRAFEALLSTNDDHQHEFNADRLGQPTIRIVKPEKLNTGVGQVKAPVVMVDSASLE